MDPGDPAGARGAQPARRLPGAAEPGRVPGVADDLDPDVPLRLRRPGRRLDGHRGLGGRDGARPRARRCGSRRWPEWSTADRHGSSGRTWAGWATPPPRRCGTAPGSRPGDVDVAQLYDGFTIEVVWWLEAMGFCGTGEAASYVEGGTRISLGGELPLNTWGGQLSGGRLHAAFGHTAEAVRQLRGEAGDRQVRGRGGGRGDQRRRDRGGGGAAHALVGRVCSSLFERVREKEEGV